MLSQIANVFLVISGSNNCEKLNFHQLPLWLPVYWNVDFSNIKLEVDERPEDLFQR